MDKKILRAYELIGDVTPAVFDCGKLCDKLCCKGDGEIWLLPGEEEMYLESSGFEVKDYGDEVHVICNTDCSDFRSARPFYCRIFPLFPRVAKSVDGEISVELAFDPRAARCPLSASGYGVTRQFCRRVRLAVKSLCRDERYFEHFKECGEFLDEMASFSERLLGVSGEMTR